MVEKRSDVMLAEQSQQSSSSYGDESSQHMTAGKSVFHKGLLFFPPFSTEGPAAADVVMDDALSKFIHAQGGQLYESVQGERNRQVIVAKLQEIITDFVCEIGLKKGIECVKGGVAQLAIFGSQRIGCHNASADIDCLCLAPNFVSRNEFFSLFVELTISIL